MTKTCTSCGQAKPLDCFNRMTSGSQALRPACKECTRAANAAYGAQNRDALLVKKREYAEQHREREYERRNAWRAVHRDQEKEQQRSYRNAHRKELTQYFKDYVERNPGKVYAVWSKRRASKRNQTPAWADPAKIEEIYQLAHEFRQAGFDVHVDHIVPISGRNVSGLHVEHNLRVCLAQHNRRKSNNFSVEV